MGRRTDSRIALALLAVALVPLAIGALVGSAVLVIAGALLAPLVGPVAYKLLRYPSTRTVSPGELVGKMRTERDGSPSSRGMLVCFSGVDGSGKTTEAEALVAAFEDVDVDAVHVWARWRPFVSYPVMGALYVTLGWRRKDYARSRVLRRVWGYFLLADQLLFFYRYIYPKLVRGRVVCVDRYLLDQLVEMRYDGLYSEHAARLIVRLLPTPDVEFLMDVPADIALERKDDTQEMLDRLHVDTDARTYLETRRELFHEAAAAFDVPIVDTTRPIAETHAEVTDRAFRSYFEF